MKKIVIAIDSFKGCLSSKDLADAIEKGVRKVWPDLEDLGYILQPHTSAGRVPSDKGYRWYVDSLMEEKEQWKP